MMNVANAITLLRFALIPVIAWQLVRREYDVALVLFIVSAVSDLADGLVARHWGQRTPFGATADPLADKLTMLTVAVLLAVQGLLPWWLTGAIVTRDLVILGGAFAYLRLIGRLDIAPTLLSKVNTALEFVLLTAMLAVAAELIADGTWRHALVLGTLATILASGVQYVVVYSRKASQARRAPQ
jgi:cardiolipin synthase